MLGTADCVVAVPRQTCCRSWRCQEGFWFAVGSICCDVGFDVGEELVSDGEWDV